jgi:hypothetical protein
MRFALSTLLFSSTLAKSFKIDITRVKKAKLNSDHKLQAVNKVAHNQFG